MAHRLGGNFKSEPTEAQFRGRLLDKMLLGVGPEIVVIDHPDYRTNAAKAARDQAEAEGKIPVLKQKMRGHADVIEGWQANLDDIGIQLSGESQVKLDWQVNGVECRGYLDHLIRYDNDSAVIYDLKSCEDASDETCRRSVATMGHDIQHAAYVQAVEETYPFLRGRVRMVFLFAEVNPPYAINTVSLAGSARVLGERKWDKAVRTWGECVRTNHFFGYFASETKIEATPWDLARFFPEGVPDEIAD